MKSNKVGLTTQASTVLDGVKALVEAARTRVALYVNTETSVLYWSIGNYLNRELVGEGRAEYGRQILATVSQELTMTYGKGYTYTALTRMRKVASVFPEEIVATLSQQLSWSHLIELSIIDNEQKRMYYAKAETHHC